MPSNKHEDGLVSRKTNSIQSVLLYALLEWTLILLLFINGLFSFLISRFASLFGLARPCIFCARVDRLFEDDSGDKRSILRLLCHDHAVELSNLRYCSSHSKLGDVGDMCEFCSSYWTRSEEGEKDLRCSCCGAGIRSCFFSPFIELDPSVWDPLKFANGEVHGHGDISEGDEMVEIGVQVGFLEFEKDVVDAVDEFSGYGCRVSEDMSVEFLSRRLRDVSFEERLLPVELIDEATARRVSVPVVSFRDGGIGDTVVKENGRDLSLKCVVSDEGGSCSVQDGRSSNDSEVCGDNCSIVEVGLLASVSKSGDEITNRVDEMKDVSAVVDSEQRLEDDELLEFAARRTDIDAANSSEVGENRKVDTDIDTGCVTDERLVSAYSAETCDDLYVNSSCNDFEHVVAQDIGAISDERAVFSSTEADDVTENSHSVLAGHEEPRNVSVYCPFDVPALEIQNVVPEVVALLADEDPGTPDTQVENNLMDAEMTRDVSIGSQICDQDRTSLTYSRRPVALPNNEEHQQPDGHTSSTTWINQATETERTSVIEQHTDNAFAFSSQNNEIEDEKTLETPTSKDYNQGLHKRMIFVPRDSTTESLDGSVAGDFEGFETMEQLKTALNAERKALSALYADLEEERCASAISANQTMAMITRLQEEKAAMQMEALQYQRMMEEQSEYDQEALHLLNELLMKREKEKQDLEKELEFYKMKDLLHETKRKNPVHKANEKDETPSASSIAEDSDDAFSDLREVDVASYVLDEKYQNSQGDTLAISGTDQGDTINLTKVEESLLDFEEERLSILEQLRTLEERLIPSEDDDTDNLEVLKKFAVGNDYLPNGNHEFLIDILHDSPIDCCNDQNANEKFHNELKSKSFKGKKLLPLFDAINDENENEVATGGEFDKPCDVSPPTKEELTIIEEFENLHDRLQALEADREFLKYCFGSLKKGDRGTHLLEEILEHLRQLRSAELQVRSKNDAVASLSA